VLGGCALLALCVLLACSASAFYWVATLRMTEAMRQPAADAGDVDLGALPTGNVDDGEQAFRDQGCSACHTLEPDQRLVGPSLAGVASRAGTRQPGYSAEEYLYESIVDPNAYVVAGFQGGLMPANYARRLDAQQLADLLAFLMTQ
jgi:nitric oxide reductase subunit C